MIYDELERELEEMCMELGIKLCQHCSKPLSLKAHGSQKFHKECRLLVRNERARKQYAKNPAPVLAAVRKYRATFKRCSCCGLRPVGDGLHFLCNMCFEWDGPDWIKEQNARWEAKRKHG